LTAFIFLSCLPTPPCKEVQGLFSHHLNGSAVTPGPQEGRKEEVRRKFTDKGAVNSSISRFFFFSTRKFYMRKSLEGTE
jgi:hypothetical protein